ncbi:hypothetical protein [Cyanobium sp. Morenito 9A2]|uniref:hypothetical protein n=1 Tax=Cyanobium sp. Morenito 9A2 TaxID=2823718 RepID=UPI0020CD2F39|nr:hypothetical protein [Cyanobium sp. Morenito 9A2]MCP9849562.1 hypothetical protein [Cyanobium sp. Morenito 9A2]
MSGISLYLCFNQVNYLAAWRQRLLERPCDLSLLLVEPSRFRLDASKPWPRGIGHLRGPSSPWTMAVLVLLALLGLIERIYIPHRRGAGRALGFVLSRCRHIHLLDDGLDQYRARPRALTPDQFPAATPLYLFSDAVPFRAPWCAHYACRELGAFPLPEQDPGGGALLASGQQPASLVVDAPGLDRLPPVEIDLPLPRFVLAHPAAGKRSWPGAQSPPAPPKTSSSALPRPNPDWLVLHFAGPLLVGESFLLVMALVHRPVDWPLLVALPPAVDPHLQAMVECLCAQRPASRLLSPVPS